MIEEIVLMNGPAAAVTASMPDMKDAGRKTLHVRFGTAGRVSSHSSTARSAT
jgi:hypothetical protein